MDGGTRVAKPSYRHYLAAAGVCAGTTLLALPLLDSIDPANIILLFVLAVTAIAALWGRGPAVLASFLAVACFNFFFVAPRFSFSVSNAEYLITFAVMLVVSLLISYLSNAYRQKALEAEQRALEAGLLHTLAEQLSGAPDLDAVSQRTQSFMQSRLQAGCTLFVADLDEQLVAVPTADAVNAVEQAAALGVYRHGMPTGAVGDLHADCNTVLIPLQGATRRRGVLAIYLSPAQDSPPDALLGALAALVATAVERIHFVEVARRSELEAASVRLRSSILSAISHDIRTPLTVLYGLADQIAIGDAAPETALALRDQAARLHRMVDNLLDMARLRSGKVELRRDWQAWPELVAASVQSLGAALAAHPLQFEWAPDLPLVRVDALLMERVLCNLLENAAKYSPPQAPLTLRGWATPDTVLLAVDNPGRGFPPERLAHVFDLFERGAAESSIPGVGIGLSICRTIVAAHGGEIVAMNLPHGARVLITLPREAAPLLPTEAEAEAEADAADKVAASEGSDVAAIRRGDEDA